MLSVLIVNWNTKPLLNECLASIFRFPPSEPFEVIVVDNDSHDGSADMTAAEFPQATLIRSPRNVGYASGNNLAALAAVGDWLLTLNPDTEFLDDSLQRSLNVLKNHPDCGALGVRQIGLDGQTQRSVRGFPTFWGILGDVTGLGNLMPRTKLGSYRLPAFDYEREQPAPQPMGTFLLFRREALQAVGDPKAPFDPQFPIFFNEVDLLYRLKQAGWPALYSPNVSIKHHGGESTKQVRKSMIWESHRSLVRFLRKHYANAWNRPGISVLEGLIYLSAFVRAKGYDAGFRS